MTWQWPIFFSVGALWLMPLAAAPVSGTVRMVDSIDPGVRKLRDYSGAAVWLEPLSATEAEAAPDRPRKLQMIQKGKRFVPHVLVIRVGTSVDFPNLDPIFHNAFSNFSGQIFDVGLYPPGSSRAVVFNRPGIVRVFCNIHPTMSAVIVVLESPWYAVSDTSGAFTIRDVPQGEYRLRVFHERATAEAIISLERKIIVPNGGLALAPITISESGYIETPHKNKHGTDYPPVIDDRVYPATRR